MTEPTKRISSHESLSAHEIKLTEAVRRIIRGYDLHSRRLLATVEITLAQLLCLRTLVELGRCTAKQLAASIHISASTMVGILDRLEAKELMTRERDQADRRRVFVTITRAGRAVVRKSPPPLGEKLQSHLALLTPAKRASLAAALSLVADLVEPEALGAGGLPPQISGAPQRRRKPTKGVGSE